MLSVNRLIKKNSSEKKKCRGGGLIKGWACNAGFTILEIMIIIGIVAIISSLVMTMFSTTNIVYRNIRTTNEIQQQVASVNETIRSRLSDAVAVRIEDAFDETYFRDNDYDGYFELRQNPTTGDWEFWVGQIDDGGVGISEVCMLSTAMPDMDEIDINFHNKAGEGWLTMSTQILNQGRELYNTSMTISLPFLVRTDGLEGIGEVTGDVIGPGAENNGPCVLYRRDYLAPTSTP